MMRADDATALPSQQQSAVLDPAPLLALSALFDDGLAAVEPGAELPPLWHWPALARWAPTRLTGPDGHPRVGGFLPDVGKPRRMFAGGTVEFLRPLISGETVQRRDVVASVTPKYGRQGEFVLVEVVTELSTPQGLAVRETQNLIYRDLPAKLSALDPVRLPPALAVEERVLTPARDGEWSLRSDPTTLMRFSSLTCNGHRIHYDLAHAVGTEGYPGLVVHGPLLALAMAETLRLSGAPQPVRISHRGLRPLFCGQEARIVQAAQTQGAEEICLIVRTSEGDHATLTATFA